MDVTAITDLLATAATAVASVGGALLLVWGTKVAYSAIRGR